jgi:hypothetical protein
MFIRLNGSGTYNSVSTSQLNKMANSNGAVYNGSNKFNVIGVLNLSAGDYFEVLLNSTNGSGQMNASVLTTATYLGE